MTVPISRLLVMLLTTAGAAVAAANQASMLVLDHEQLKAAQTFVSGQVQVDNPPVMLVGAPAAPAEQTVAREIDPNSTERGFPPIPAVTLEDIAEPVVPKLPARVTAPDPVFKEAPIPDGTERPDLSGFITLVASARKGQPVPLVAGHNPWGVRVVTKDTLVTYSIHLDGVIIGSGSGATPTALINDNPTHIGETLIGPFTLYGIRRHAVIMEYDASYFLIPEGRDISVRIPKT